MSTAIRLSAPNLVALMYEQLPETQKEFAHSPYLPLTTVLYHLQSPVSRGALYDAIIPNCDRLQALGFLFAAPEAEFIAVSRQVHGSGWRPGSVYAVNPDSLAALLCIFNGKFARRAGWKNNARLSAAKNLRRLLHIL